MTNEEDLIRVGKTSNPKDVGSVLAKAIVAGRTPTIRAIGAAAVNQSVKACAIARGFVAPRGIDLMFVIGFDDLVGESGETISAISLRPVARI